jgi:hypothetical protein
MSAREARRLVVTNGGTPLGIITEHDLLATRISSPDSRGDEKAVASEVGDRASAPAPTNTGDVYEEQGICGVCGSFTQDLISIDGQMRCSDCRGI